MEHFKSGFLEGASPKALFYGQVIGPIVGSVVSTFVYRLYSSTYTIPSDQFPAPAAQLWLATAKLVYGRGLLEGVWNFAVDAFLLSAVFAAVRTKSEDHSWANNFQIVSPLA
jgi:uncharacterized oligopeptide transporter (OPT) family protein